MTVLMIANSNIERFIVIAGDGDSSTAIGMTANADLTHGNRVAHMMGNDLIELGTLEGTGRYAIVGDTDTATTTINSGKNNIVYYLMGNDRMSVDASNAAIDLAGDIISFDVIIDNNSRNNTVIYKFGDDVVTGGLGQQALFGDASNIEVDDQGINNTVKFIYGNDILTGGTGADFFVFRVSDDNTAGQGNDTITDLSADEGDTLQFSNVIGDIDELDSATEVGDNGTDVVIQFQDDSTITLLGIGTGNLTSLQALDDAGYNILIA